MAVSEDTAAGDDSLADVETDEDGLVAVGGSLHPDVLEKAYRMGIFPWSSHPAVTWWCPDPRAIFELDAFHVSRSLRKTIRRLGWTFHLDRDFEGTMRRCAESTADRPNTWISEHFIAGYCELHRRGEAHSVEVYEGDAAVGGLYGVAFGGSCPSGISFARPRIRAARCAGDESASCELGRSGHSAGDVLVSLAPSTHAERNILIRSR